MFSLIDPMRVISRLNLSVDMGLLESVREALSGAVVSLQSRLSTSFSFAPHSDFFFVPKYAVAQDSLYTLLLSHGFARYDDLPLTVFSASTLGELQSIAIDSPGALPTIIDYEKGRVRIPAQGMEGKYLMALYEAGFKEGDILQDPPTYGEIDLVPDWLAEAAISMTIEVLAQSQINDGKPELSAVLPLMKAHSTLILDANLRLAGPPALRPL